MMKQVFRNVYVVKPQSSRASSAESFVVGVGFKENSNLAGLSDSITTLKAMVAQQEEKLKDLNIEEKVIESIEEESEEEDKLTF